MKINLILLAAGSSRRFGSNKLLYEFEGKLMYRHIVDEIAKLKDDVFAKKIVISQYNEILSGLSKEGYMAIRNTESQLGISYSIQLGINAAKEGAWCFLVADQPYLTARTMENFVAEFRKSGKHCGCVRYGERSGNPCIFTKKYREELLELSGDIGGKRIIKQHLEETFFYHVENEKELEDIDILGEKEESICII